MCPGRVISLFVVICLCIGLILSKSKRSPFKNFIKKNNRMSINKLTPSPPDFTKSHSADNYIEDIDEVINNIYYLQLNKN
jgi:hypothetical protein